MFEIGNVVEITNKGETYSTYSDWINKNCEEYKQYYVPESLPNNGDYGIIRCLAKHSRYLNMNLALVQIITSNQVYVIGIKGLRKTDKANLTELIVDNCICHIDYDDNKEREEKDMNKVLKLYEERKLKEIDDKYDKKVEDDYNAIEVVKQYNDLVKNFEDNLEKLFTSLDNFDNNYLVTQCDSNCYKYALSEGMIKNKIMDKYAEEKIADKLELDNLIGEVDAQLSLSDDLTYQLEVLNRYGIIDKKTNKMTV